MLFRLIGVAVFATFGGGFCWAGLIELDYTFAAPTIVPVVIDGTPYSRVSMTDTYGIGSPGQPRLPARPVRILIPWGETVTGIEVTGQETVIGSGYVVEPVGKPVPISGPVTPEHTPQPDPAIYGSAEPFPPARFVSIGTQGFRGYNILILRLQPTKYVATTGTLSYYSQLHVTVQTAAGDTNPLFRGLTEDAEAAAARVSNPATISTYPTTRARGASEPKLLILTLPEYAEAFEPLQTAHNAAGRPTLIHALPSGVTWEQIRTHIRSVYLSDYINFVLIGAGDDTLPSPKLTIDTPAGYTSGSMPTDSYLGCLDGVYDPNEPLDVDLHAEVYVGRAPAESAAEVENFVSKSISYLTSQHAHLDRVLLVGEYIKRGPEYASECMDELIDGTDLHGPVTTGIPRTSFEIDRLDDAPQYRWPVTALLDRMNAGVHWINHLGHGISPERALKICGQRVYASPCDAEPGALVNDIDALSNMDYFFLYSQACYPGWFDGKDCLAKYFTTKSAKGAFAVLMNAREGVGAPAVGTAYPAQWMFRWFWHGVFSEDVEKRTYGEAAQYARETCSGLFLPGGVGCPWRYACYELTLFGDPSLPIHAAQESP